MKKQLKSVLVLTFALVVLSTASSFAQGRFSIGANLAFPQGDAGDAVSTGFGIDGRYEAPINDNLSWMASIGVIAFGEKDNNDVKATLIPINGGIKYYFDGQSFSGFYAGGELGFNIVKYKVGDNSDSETEIGLAPQIGYHIANFDFSLRYAIINDADFVGLRVAYVLGE